MLCMRGYVQADVHALAHYKSQCGRGGMANHPSTISSETLGTYSGRQPGPLPESLQMHWLNHSCLYIYPGWKVPLPLQCRCAPNGREHVWGDVTSDTAKDPMGLDHSEEKVQHSPDPP